MIFDPFCSNGCIFRQYLGTKMVYWYILVRKTSPLKKNICGICDEFFNFKVIWLVHSIRCRKIQFKNTYKISIYQSKIPIKWFKKLLNIPLSFFYPLWVKFQKILFEWYSMSQEEISPQFLFF